MPKYFIEDDLYEDQWNKSPTTIEVAEHKPRFTGLYSADEEPIMKEPRPIGFGRDNEW